MGKMQKEILRMQKWLEKKALSDVDEMEIQKENIEEKLKYDEIDGMIAFNNQWIIAIYDLGKSYLFLFYSVCILRYH